MQAITISIGLFEPFHIKEEWQKILLLQKKSQNILFYKSPRIKFALRCYKLRETPSNVNILVVRLVHAAF